MDFVILDVLIMGLCLGGNILVWKKIIKDFWVGASKWWDERYL